MILSVPHNFVFVHVYKTGGTSIRQALMPWRSPTLPKKMLRFPARRRGLLNLYFSGHQSMGELHPHTSAVQLQSLLAECYYRSFFKFAFVRNPFDWVVSLYHFMGENADSFRLSHPRLSQTDGFDAFVDRLCSLPPECQADYLCDGNGHLLMDFVGRFETLATDFDFICQRIGVRAKLPHLNRSVHGDYRTYYDHRSANLIAKRYERDLTLFGYCHELEGSR